MTNLMYETGVAASINSMKNLAMLLDKAEAFATERKFDVDVLMQSRLAPDMFPLGFQVYIAATFAKNLACRLAGQEPPDYPREQMTIAAARALIARTIDILSAIKPDALNGSEAKPITFNVAPDTAKTMPGAAYMNKFAIPNIMFHVTTAYAILRHNGVQIGKRDFIGSLD